MSESTRAFRSRKGYRIYLLRMWQEGPELACRIMLEDGSTREQYGFATLEHLFSFLNQSAISGREAS